MKKLLLLSALLLACEKPTEPEPPSMTGHWIGPNADLVVTQTGENFSGNGNYSGSSCTISGLNNHPSVSFTITTTANTYVASGTFYNDNEVRYTFPTDAPGTIRYLNRQ